VINNSVLATDDITYDQRVDDSTTNNDYITNNNDYTTTNNDYITNNKAITNNNTIYKKKQINISNKINVNVINDCKIEKYKYKNPVISVDYNIIKEEKPQSIRIEWLAWYIYTNYKNGACDIVIKENSIGYYTIRNYFHNRTTGTYISKVKAHKLQTRRSCEL